MNMTSFRMNDSFRPSVGLRFIEFLIIQQHRQFQIERPQNKIRMIKEHFKGEDLYSVVAISYWFDSASESPHGHQ
jgi:hypothetical protein